MGSELPRSSGAQSSARARRLRVPTAFSRRRVLPVVYLLRGADRTEREDDVGRPWMGMRLPSVP